MKFRISESSAAPLATAAIGARIFYGAAVGMPELHSAAWISVLLGTIFSVPLILAICAMRRQCSQRSHGDMLFRPTAAVFVLSSIYDAAVIARALINSASYIALNSLPILVLVLPLLALCLWCLTLNGDAIGSAAAIWLRILPWPLLLVIILEFSAFRPAWLLPVWGPGLWEIVDGGVQVAGWISSIAAIYLIAEPGASGKTPLLAPAKILGVCGLASCLLIILKNMMTPSMFMERAPSIFFQLDTLLSNGRASLSLQLPMAILWFVSLLFLLLYDAFISAAMLERLLPKIGKHLCMTVILTGIGALSLSGVASREAAANVSRWLYAVHGTMVSLCMIRLLIKEGGKVRA